MRILVTGATSFVGSGAVKELLRRGHEVVAVVRTNTKKKEVLMDEGRFPIGLHFVELDLTEISKLPTLVNGSLDVFLHMGWLGSGSDARTMEEMQKHSHDIALTAVSVAKELGAKRFLFTGSQAEYGIYDRLCDETMVCHPTSAYGSEKLRVFEDAGALCETLGLDYGHIRIFSTYGPGDHPWTLISSCVKNFTEGKRMEVSSCTQTWNFLYIDDAARAIAALCEYEGRLSDHGSIYNLAGPMEETGELRQFVEMLYTACGRKSELIYGRKAPNAEGVVNLIPDTRKLTKVTGWKPQVRFEEGIVRILSSI